MMCPADPLSSRAGGAAGSPAVAGCEPASAMPPARELARDFIVDLPACPETLRVGVDPVPCAPTPCVIAIGAFDGVHRGHLDLLQRAKRDARERGLAVVAVTFDPDPDEVVSAHPAPKLTSMADRVRALASAGAGVAIVPFTRELAALDHIGFSSGSSLHTLRSVPFTWGPIFALVPTAHRPSTSCARGAPRAAWM